MIKSLPTHQEASVQTFFIFFIWIMISKTLHVGILASTNGTILPKIFSADLPDVEFSVFLTDKEHCGAREKAKQHGIPDFFIDPKGASRKEWGMRAVEILKKHKVDLVILVGFMKILPPEFVQQFPMRILNVHPSLLPKFAGGMNMDVHSAVLEANEKESGATIHFVTEAVDGGPIFLQESVQIDPDETPESLKQKVQKIEGELFPKAIFKFQEEADF
jgi:phosphoribosylglycinamide formyltransferase-1